MTLKEQTKKKKGAFAAPRIDSLHREVRENLAAWTKNPAPFAERLSLLAPAEKEELFVRLLPADPEGAGPLLKKLSAAGPPKEIAKAIRKAVFRLRSKGIAVQEVDLSPPPVYHPPRPAGAEAYVTSIDATGGRLVWLAQPQLPQGLAVFSGLMHDHDGIVEFTGFETSRKHFHEILQSFEAEYQQAAVKVDPVYCHGLLEEASQAGQKRGKTPPDAFLKLRPLLGPAPALPLKPLIYNFLPAEEVKAIPDLLDKSAALFEDRLLQGWFLEEQDLKKYQTLLQEASTSRLVLTPQQTENRYLEVYRQAVQELFDEPRRLLYRRRLEEVAYILLKTGKENEARICLAAALGLEKADGILSPHPFLLELVKRSLVALFMQEEKAREEEPGGLIIKP
jgi:hypothetical protein